MLRLNKNHPIFLKNNSKLEASCKNLFLNKDQIGLIRYLAKTSTVEKDVEIVPKLAKNLEARVENLKKDGERINLFQLEDPRFIQLIYEELNQENENLEAVDNAINGIEEEIKELTISSVMILGGSSESYKLKKVYIFNSANKDWKLCNFSLPCSKSSFGAIILKDELYTCGIDDREIEKCYKLGENNEWIEIASMNERRGYISGSTIVFNSEIWAIGGDTGSGEILKSVEKYNPQDGVWSFMPELNHGRSLCAASIIGGKIYVSGGWNGRNHLNSIEVFDPAKNNWEIFCELPFGVGCHCSAVEETNLIIIGGWKSTGKLSNEVWKVNILDPNREWIRMDNLLQERSYHGAVKLTNEGLMVFGGTVDYRTILSKVERFDGEAWIEEPDLPLSIGSFAWLSLSKKNEERFLQLYCQ